MENQMSQSENLDLTNISEFDSDFQPVLPSSFKDIDLKTFILEMEETHRQIRQQMPKGPNYLMRSESKRLKSLLTLVPTSTWSPCELAAAGFYFTGISNSSQCFCCGLVLCRQSLTTSPMQKHKKCNPSCGFVQGKDVGNISKYEVRLQPLEPNGRLEKDAMKSEERRLGTFKGWPVYAAVEPQALAHSGFYFTGRRDTVQCFSCDGCLGNWEENDDPWKEHAKWFPECVFLRSEKSEAEISQYIDNYCGFHHFPGMSFCDIYGKGVQCSQKETAIEKEIILLKSQLIKSYSNPTFHRISSFGECVDPIVDLNSVFADIAVSRKNTRNQPLEQLTLPDILSDLRDITMIEGEAGSGKTALLKKIAILWASGTCPMLSRFKLVFYISVTSIDNDSSLADIICKQLSATAVYLPKETLAEMMKQLKNQILFLLDDYGFNDTTPEAIDEILLKNHVNLLSLAVSVRTDKGKKLRQYARTILEIQKFPLYSTIYLVKNLFLHDGERVKAFFIELETYKNLQAALHVPLMTLSQCSYWVQNPHERSFCERDVFEAYLNYNMQKVSWDTNRINCVIMSCGDLALHGVFHSCFDFTEEDLCTFVVDIDDAITLGLLSKFSAQRLRPVHRFSNNLFQEFLAGKRMSELLESEEQEKVDRGLHYLHRVNTFLKLQGPYSYLLKYASRISPKATVKIMSHLFSFYDNKDALDCHFDNRDHLQRYPELQIMERLLIFLLSVGDSEFCMNLLLTFAVKAAVDSRCLSECAPVILQFLRGKNITLDLNPISGDSNSSLFYFMEKYPECIALLSCITCRINPRKFPDAPDFSTMSQTFENYGVPTVEQDYSAAYLSMNALLEEKQKEINQSNETLSYFPQTIQISDSVIKAFSSLRGHKAPVFKLVTNNICQLAPSECEKLRILFSVSDHIKLELNKSNGFVRNIMPVIEQYLSSFKECTICNTYLCKEEQELLLRMASLETLEFGNVRAIPQPESLISGVHRFMCLKELSINLPTYPEFIEHIPDEFGRLNKIKKLALCCDFAHGSTRFAQFIRNFGKLEVLQLNCESFPDFNGLMTSLTYCNDLKELSFSESNLKEDDLASLAQTMAYFKSLKVLNLKSQKILSSDVAETLVCALGSLVHLEKLFLPEGDGMVKAANLLIGQLHNYPNLQHLTMSKILNDESIEELGGAAQSGYLKKLCQLELDINNNVTESGWRAFFQKVDNMPELSLLNINRMYTHSIKSHPTTVTSFVQCVSRLPSLTTTLMLGWLLDEEDLNMFNAMKEKHPQSKSLTIHWQWYLPFPPNIKE
ncbi:baculoviral IAP repeat-containing protein 1 [Xenopus laevis]|uniref:Baculoviral IAP repeat-containing protein 1 n=2 Tax=Xenopus laevis TaxID=8355 RepID=A0A1L8I2M8_XENLA|nr:baculoviral IAP repeat-containing protein 1 [Xenopus laevis]XP_041424642.1 baculoviral IAP repeat-containing protein 1 [Xenopus laevis]OCU02368.1 hypothetical protein XELAEV_18008130mg [Xenopus laevis]